MSYGSKLQENVRVVFSTIIFPVHTGCRFSAPPPVDISTGEQHENIVQVFASFEASEFFVY
jgi:hypothetical protein